MPLSDAVAGKPAKKKKSAAKKPAKKTAAKKPAEKKKTSVDEGAAPVAETPKKKKAETKKAPAAKEGKIIPISQGKNPEEKPTEETTEETTKNTSLIQFDDFRLPALEIDGQKGLSFSMTQLDHAMTEAHKAVSANDYKRAVIVCHQFKNGKYQEIGFKGGAHYYGDKFGMNFKIAMRYQKVIWFLREIVGLSRDDQLQKTYENLIVNRVDQLATYVSGGVMTAEQAKEEMAFCVQESGKSNEEWAMYMKERWGKAIAQAKKDAGGSDGLIPVKGFRVDDIDFDMIVQAQKLAGQMKEQPGLPLGDAMVMASQHFVSHYGEGVTNVAATITAIEKAHGLVLIPLPLPGSKAVPDISAIKVYEKDGTLIFMDSKRAAAKYFGVTTAEVNEVAIDPRPYLHKLGYSDKPKDLANSLPKTLDELTDEEAMEKVASLLKDLGMSRGDWTDKAVGKSIRQQIAMLLELKGKKLDGEPVLIDGKTPDKKKAETPAKKKAAKAAKEKEESSATNLDEAEEKAKAKKSKKSSGKEKGLKPKPEPEPEPEDEDEDEDAIFEGDDGKLYLDEEHTKECDEYGVPVEDGDAFDVE